MFILKKLVVYVKFTCNWGPVLYLATLPPSFPVSYSPFPTYTSHINGLLLYLGLRLCAGGPQTEMVAG